MSLAAWLTARIDDDERWAVVASRGPWVVGHTVDLDWGPHPRGNFGDIIIDHDGQWPRPMTHEGSHVCVTGEHPHQLADLMLSRPGEREANAAHIARHDPARVLCEVASKRLLLELHKQCDHTCYILCVLAVVYCEHDGYLPEWRITLGSTLI